MPNHTQTAPAENGQAHPTSSPSTPADVDTGSVATLGWPEHTSPDLGEGDPEPSVRGPVAAAWREGTLTRAQELDSLCSWVIADHPKRASASLIHGVRTHIEAARQAASVAALNPKRYLHLPRYGSLRERAMSNLDAAEAHLLNIAPAEYLLGQMPSLLQDARRHLVPGDPRREELGRIAGRIGLNDPDHPQMQIAALVPYEERKRIVAQERVQIVAATRAASSASLREQVRVRSFRNVVVATTVVMSLLAIALATIGFRSPILLPLCFAPEEAGSAVVVCPTAAVGTVLDGTSRYHSFPDIPRHRQCGRGNGATVGSLARRADRAGRRRGRRSSRNPEDSRIVGTIRSSLSARCTQAANRSTDRVPRPPSHARPVRARPERPRHLCPDPGLGSRFRLRPTAIHAAGGPARPNRTEQRPGGEQCTRRQHPDLTRVRELTRGGNCLGRPWNRHRPD